jgi:hypothetical protein
MKKIFKPFKIVYIYLKVSNLFHSSFFLICVPLVLAAFAHLWNPIGFLYPEHDETVYLQRAMHVLRGQGPQEGSLYDHPYFSQLFLAGIFKVIGYPNSLNPSIDIHSIEMLYVVPRVLMGLLAIVDTFLVYKISERCYNRKVAFFASVLFGVMPLTWMIRRSWLESIQLPFILLSILFAAYVKNGENTTSRKTLLTILFSGISLGLAIFTKIPAFTFIPLAGFLIFKKNNNNKKNLQNLGLWFIPVILIPLIWPAYSISTDSFHGWLGGIFYQTHRTGGSDLFSVLRYDFPIDPVLFICGVSGLVYAGIRRDHLLLLWAFPFLIFLDFINWVQYFHLIPLLPVFCIATAKLIEDLSNKIRNKKLQKSLAFVIISGIGIFGLASTLVLITPNVTSSYYEAATFVVKYLHDYDNTKNTDKMTLISNPKYSWIPRDVFHLQNDYVDFLSSYSLKSKNALLILDAIQMHSNAFITAMSRNDEVGRQLSRIYNLYGKYTLATIGYGPPPAVEVVIKSNNPCHSDMGQLNIISQRYTWKPINDATISQICGHSLIVKADTSHIGTQSNYALLKTQINTTKNSVPLSLEYSSESHLGKAIFRLAITDISNKLLWNKGGDLGDTGGMIVHKVLTLPKWIIAKPIKVRFQIITQERGEHELTVNKAIFST